MDRAVKILAALFVTAALVLAVAIVMGVFQYVIPQFDKLQAHPHTAALTGLGFAYLTLLMFIYIHAARLIWQRKNWRMAMILALVSCLGIPVGPVLGVAALVLLTRPGVRKTFAG